MKKTIHDSSPDPGFADVKRNAESDAYALLLHHVRSELMKAMENAGISRADLAKKLGVSRSVISRVLDPTSDILISTTFDLAWALQMQWKFFLTSIEDGPVASAQYFYDDDAVANVELWEDALIDGKSTLSSHIEYVDA